MCVFCLFEGDNGLTSGDSQSEIRFASDLAQFIEFRLYIAIMSLNFFKILILTGSIANALHLTNSGSKNHIASWGKILASKGKTLASILPLSVVLTASSVPVQAEVIQSSPTTIASGSSKNTPFYFGIG